MKGDGADHVTKQVQVPCPTRGGEATVGFTVQNPWDPEKGSHVKGCTLLKPGESCHEECTHTPQGLACIHNVSSTDLAEHKEDLGTVGPNVLG